MSKRIAYITGQTPYGQEESYITREMLSLKESKINLLIIPRNPAKNIVDEEAGDLFDDTLRFPVINFIIIKYFFTFSFKKLKFLLRIIYKILKNSRNIKIVVKNLAVLPKSIYITRIVKNQNINHVHAQWGCTTATMAYIISQLTDIPWSFTLHRWDISENNMLQEKVKSAEFTRCISELGKDVLIKIVGKEYKEKIKVVHVGIKVPNRVSARKKERNTSDKFTIVTPANLLEVKGHEYLIIACSFLIKQGIKNFQCFFYGEGPVRTKLENIIKEKRLSDYIKIPGWIIHRKLMKMYKNKEVDAVILPSIITKKDEHEGIPVSLMEAMAWQIPVVSTNTGGIPELLSNDAGMLVEQKNSEQLADAIKDLMRNKKIRECLSQNGYNQVLNKFNIDKITNNLIDLIKL